MTPQQTQFLDAFPIWLKRLPEDVRGLAAVLIEVGSDSPAASTLAGALNYLFRSLDLIPDGIEDLGFVDDAFVLRVAVAGLPQELKGKSDVLTRLSEESQLIREFLGEDYSRLEAYVLGVNTVTVRGRSVDAILAEAAVREEFLAELKSWADSFEPPSFARDVRNLTKLSSFLRTRLSKFG